METVSDSQASVRAYLEAEDIADRAGQSLSSLHLLLGLFTFPNRAQALLIERGIDEDRLLEHVRVLEDEPRRTVTRLRDRARDIAKSSGSPDADCLHLLIALTRLRDAFGYRVLERTGVSVTALRNLAVSYVTGHMPRRFKTIRADEGTPVLTSGRGRTKTLVQPASTPAPAVMREAVKAPDDDDDDELAGYVVDEPPAAVPAAAPAAGSLEEIAPTLAQCGVELVALARSGQIDPAVGRDRELEALVDILGKRRSNNPVLVGPPGVGKTAIVEGLAVKVARGDEDVRHLRDCYLVAMDTGAMVAGTSLRGAFSERMAAIKDEVSRAGRKILVFIDELHTLIGAGSSGEGPQDAANELKTALARGEFPCIGATTVDEFKKYIEKDPALERRFTPIIVNEPSVDEAILILEGAIQAYSEHHRVDYSMAAVHASVTLAHRFIPDRKLPDKAFAVVDLAGSRARRRGARGVDRTDIAKVIHEWSGVPLDRLVEVDTARFAQAEHIIGQNLIGHTDVVEAVARGIRRGFAGFNTQRPIASFLFLGPTGVGKTQLVKVLAEFLFGRRDAIVRFDMSEFAEKHSVARLLGAQPGYVGYEEGGQLTEALRKRPFQVVLFDEVEKAHPDVLNVFLQILDEGFATDSRGRRVSFANTVIVLTSNLGAEGFSASSGGIGFGATERQNPLEAVLESARGQLAPELWGRLDERLVFQPLDREQVGRIAELQLEESGDALFAEREISLEWNEDVLEFLLDRGGYSPQTGARGMRQTIQRYVEGPLSEAILAGAIDRGSVAELHVRGDAIRVHLGAEELAAG
ncbi:MAG: ATP-dependent Clp protease ATP-binding subunit [Myxococcota bacterium]